MSVGRQCENQHAGAPTPGLDQETIALHRVVNAGGDTVPSYACIKSLMHHPGPDSCQRLPWICSHAVVDTLHASLLASIVKRMYVSEAESGENVINKIKKAL